MAEKRLRVEAACTHRKKGACGECFGALYIRSRAGALGLQEACGFAFSVGQLLEQARAALDESRACLYLCEPEGNRLRLNAPEDAEVRALCERVGYGAVMDAAARLWRRGDGIGAHTTGPCVGTVQDALAQVQAALDALAGAGAAVEVTP